MYLSRSAGVQGFIPRPLMRGLGKSETTGRAGENASDELRDRGPIFCINGCSFELLHYYMSIHTCINGTKSAFVAGQSRQVCQCGLIPPA